MAGIEAQLKYRASSVRNYHAHSDYEHAVDYLLPFSESTEEVNAWLRLLVIRTKTIINSEIWSDVVAGLAKILVQKRTLNGRETEDAIRELLQSLTENLTISSTPTA